MFSKLFFCLIFLTALTPLYSQEPLAQQLKSIIENKKATVGIAVLYNGKILVTVNDKAGYPMMSTFKFPLALAVLERLDKQGLPLETELFISKPDLHPDTYSPLREARPEGNFKITIGELLKYSVALSDNNACDILIDYLGGTSALQKYVRRQGIKQMKITATEDRMHKSGDPYLSLFGCPFAGKIHTAGTVIACLSKISRKYDDSDFHRQRQTKRSFTGRNDYRP